ncbi:hypothetical protein ACPA9J_15210 [Pseudomonas aeruginosa]
MKHDRTETVDNNETITIGASTVPRRSATTRRSVSARTGTEDVGSNETISIGVDRTRRRSAATEKIVASVPSHRGRRQRRDHQHRREP